MDSRGRRRSGQRVENPTYKYQHIVNVLLGSDVGANPDELAAEVRRRDPRGTYAPARICQDINRILNRSGQFTPEKVRLRPQDYIHVAKMRDDMKVRGVWRTR